MGSSSQDRLNVGLARLLGLGTVASCALILIGMVEPALGLRPRFGGLDPVSAGIVLLIALPAARVATMGVWFLRDGGRGFALISACVLAIIVASTLLGMHPG